MGEDELFLFGIDENLVTRCCPEDATGGGEAEFEEESCSFDETAAIEFEAATPVEFGVLAPLVGVGLFVLFFKEPDLNLLHLNWHAFGVL